MKGKLPINFDWEFYLEHYKDLRNVGLKTEEQAKRHYLNHGQHENRLFYDSKKNLLNQVKNIKNFTEKDYEIIKNHNLEKSDITVLITLYNYENFITKTINSVLSNNLDNIEILIVNDNSKDNSLNLVLPFLETKCNITIINKKTNTGVIHSRNLGIENSTGEFIFMLDADNVIYQNCLIEHYNKIKNTPLIACYGIIEFYDNNNNKICETSNKEYDFEKIKKYNYIDNMAIFNKNKLKDIGGYDIEMMGYGYGWEDYELWLKIGYLNYEVGFINKQLSRYISKPNSLVTEANNFFCTDIKNYLNKKYGVNIEISCLNNVKKEIELIKNNSINVQKINVYPKIYEVNNKKSLFTICTVDRLSQAKTLGDSFIRYNENYDFIIFLVGNIDSDIDIGYKIINVKEIELSEFNDMFNKYELGEFCFSMKPFCFMHLFKKYNFESIIYLDCDILVFNKFNEVEDDLDNYDIFLTPHNVYPSYYDIEINSNIYGLFNLGFIGLKKSENSLKFLEWWSERLKKYCKIDINKGLFGDQLWVNLAIVFFKKIKIITDVGYNVSYWNLNERSVSIDKGVYTINKKNNLVFYHFSGYKFDEQISKGHYEKNIDFFSDFVFIFYEYIKLNYINGHNYFNNIKYNLY